MDEGNSRQLDQFFTRDAVALRCLDQSFPILKKLGYMLMESAFLEPSAGGGAFIRALEAKAIKDIYAFDIDVQQKYIKQADFLNSDLSKRLPKRESLVVVGNPPFGKRARLAIGFVNKAFEYADTVVFILPLQFDKYSAQSQINKDAKLVYRQTLDAESFTFNGEDYAVRCCLQIWTLRSAKGLKNLRIQSPPRISHPDFEMWQYNNTRQAEKYFDKETYGWDFAVPRQGYKDYSLKETDADSLDRRTQWIFFKTYSSKALKNLHAIDFNKLSHKNTSTPGFGKADVVEEYEKLFPSKS